MRWSLWVVLALVKFSLGQDDLVNLEGRSKACDVLIAIDQTLWEHHDRNMTVLVNLAKDHVEGLNRIYSQQVFIDEFDDYYFHLKRVQLAFGICESHLFEENYEKNCTEQRQVYLNAFDEHSPTGFCLSYILTFLDFHNGTAGLASVNTVCRRTQNSGFVTLLNNNVERDLQESVITFAHEVAHNFNATHDNNQTDTECIGKGYIMEELYQSDNQEKAGEFSPCSLKSIKSKLAELTPSSENCFRDLTYQKEPNDLQISICGNGIVEEGEECDCGLTGEDCNDPCCYPAIISSYERGRNLSAMSCSRNSRSQCLTRPALIYGFYLPFAFILVSSIVICLVLNYDWKRDKKLFTHITQNNIHIK